MGSTEPAIAFATRTFEPPALEIRVNFGMFAGREATPAEIDALAAALRDKVTELTIVAEERHEMSAHSEASIHQALTRWAYGQPHDPFNRSRNRRPRPSGLWRRGVEIQVVELVGPAAGHEA